MLGTLSSWLTRTTISEDEWAAWEEWQQKQPPLHYEKSDIFQYYLSYRPNFQPPQNSVSVGCSSEYYNYCFGEFAVIMAQPNGGGDIVGYITLLLDVYDMCKGTSRRITGDPVGIVLLRAVVNKRSLIPLQTHNFSQYNYDYGRIHAHTVVQYSLSTLMMRFVSNYMHHICARGRFYAISPYICQKAYNEHIFGDPKRNTNLESNPIDIPKITAGSPGQGPRKFYIEETKGNSWPRDHATCLRCKMCNRVAENIWGKFAACLDCHLKRICSECSAAGVIIAADKLPKCYLHSKQ